MKLTLTAERADLGNQRILVFESVGHTARRNLFGIADAWGTEEINCKDRGRIRWPSSLAANYQITFGNNGSFTDQR